ncbi:hypothetical protein [Bacillus sp. JCM 19041]|uniref:hypothetical protein n=1 Tax=Bacillus sp. JCM 19041 TaxID=1460637 RepID=UPI000A78FA6B
MDPIIQVYLDHPEKIDEAFNAGIRDEEFLYNLIEKKVGFGKIRAHHYRLIMGSI